MTLDELAQAARAKAAELDTALSAAQQAITDAQALIESLTPQRDLHTAAAATIDAMPADHKAVIDGLNGVPANA